MQNFAAMILTPLWINAGLSQKSVINELMACECNYTLSVGRSLSPRKL
ncbi:hypothetical protein EDF78_10172 [Rahnella sp. BIGb0236]|jgi:hypothetical protein|nr:hypothetical protein EDF78_10172 [Rahnella sp. BIGb0236]VTQ52686.1 Uncharacterised protein [Campylobacter jejuni]